MRLGHLFDHGDAFAEQLLPALVLGWVAWNEADPRETPWRDDRRDRDSGVHEPPWLARFGHQYGGYSCLQAEVGGLVMPLRGRKDAVEVVASLEVLACDSPDDRAIRLRPDLMPLHLTGSAYGAGQLEALRQALAPCPSLPAPIAGEEALVELDASDVAQRLRGWKVLGPELPRGSHLADADAGDVAMGPPALYEHAQLDDRLVAAARAHCPSQPLRLLLLWYNSD